jgi:8-oxo-dGTP diphosphatase
MNIGRFYAGVGGLIWAPTQNKYLLLKRSAEKDYAAGVWECVTGRVDQGEGFEEALRREIYEELGVADVEIDFIIGTTHFYRGRQAAENELVGVVYACSISDPGAIQTSYEHSAYRWVTAAEAYQLLTASDPSTGWIRRVIERAELIRSNLPASLGTFYRRHGFELG